MSKRYWVYIITDKPYGTLYVGMTGDLFRRSYEHREGIYEGFSRKYGLKILVWYEEHGEVNDAIKQEKKLKKWKREWKVNLIKAFNHKWDDLYETLNI